MSGNTAIDVAKLQEQLAKNQTVYNTGAGIITGTGNTGSGNTGTGNGHNGQTSSSDSDDSVSTCFNSRIIIVVLVGNLLKNLVF